MPIGICRESKKKLVKATCRRAINIIISPILNFTKIHSLGGELIAANNQTGDRTDMTKLIGSFLDFAKST